MFPLPNWRCRSRPNFRSPLIWDLFAVGTYFTVSLLFWFTGLIPDLATLRDRSTAHLALAHPRVSRSRMKKRGSNRHWRNYERARVPGSSPGCHLHAASCSACTASCRWTSRRRSSPAGTGRRIFPPYFLVAGAIFSGFAMVETVLLIARSVFKLDRVVLMRHLELMNKFLLLTSLLVGYAYDQMEFFIAWYSGNEAGDGALPPANRPMGPYYWACMPGWSSRTACGAAALLRFKRFRHEHSGDVRGVDPHQHRYMWFERFVIIVSSSLNRDFLPSSWGYVPADDHRRRRPSRARSASSSRSSCSSCAGCRWCR